MDEIYPQLQDAGSAKEKESKASKLINTDPMKIKWTSSLLSNLCRGKKADYKADAVGLGLYRPFSKQYVYYEAMLNHRFKEKLWPSIDAHNLVIQVTGTGENVGFSCLISNMLPNLHTISGGQCFPLFVYEREELEPEKNLSLFDEVGKSSPGYKKLDGISEDSLTEFRRHYQSAGITKEQIFFFCYGVLHSQEYRNRYADNLTKTLPRIPMLKTLQNFQEFESAGRRLAELHLGYEKVKLFPASIEGENSTVEPVALYRVEQMKNAKSGKDKDLSTIHYNHVITVKGIPLEAYEYVVNGKAAIEWVMERQSVSAPDKNSGISNDANAWANETVGNPRYPLELLLKVVTVSLETMKIVKSLPQLEI